MINSVRSNFCNVRYDILTVCNNMFLYSENVGLTKELACWQNVPAPKTFETLCPNTNINEDKIWRPYKLLKTIAIPEDTQNILVIEFRTATNQMVWPISFLNSLHVSLDRLLLSNGVICIWENLSMNLFRRLQLFVIIIIIFIIIQGGSGS